jgi:hypothetical protein
MRTETALMPSFAERHYSVEEIADMWALGPDATRKLFEREPGVMVLGDTQSTIRKRKYTTLRIPESVAQRVHRRMLNL